MKKNKVNSRVYSVLFLRENDASHKVSLGKRLYFFINDNPIFENPVPSMDELQEATDNLSQALNKADGSDLGTETLALMENAFDIIAVRVKEYVDSVANSNPATATQVILSAGLQTRKAWQKSPVPDPVTVISAIYTYQAGTILTKWKGTKFSRFYRVYMTTNMEDFNSWELIVTTTKKSVLIKDLQTGTRYFFKVVAVGTAGESAESGMANCLAA